MKNDPSAKCSHKNLPYGIQINYFQHDIILIEAGVDLSENIDERLDEVQNDICGRSGEAAKWESIINGIREDFKELTNQTEEMVLETDTQRSRAESVARDFENVARMSDAEYEANMRPARRQVDALKQIYIHNEYKPLLAMAEEERGESVNLLNEVKERFGGGETTGRCHGDREPKDFSQHRLQPATHGNFDFLPGDISKIDSEGELIDNSHIYDEGYDPYRSGELSGSDTGRLSNKKMMHTTGTVM